LDKPTGEDKDDPLAARIGQDINKDWFSDISFYDIIRVLDSKEQSVLTLAYVYDQSESNIATMLGTYSVQVSRLKRRALKKLRERYTYEELIN